MRLERPAEMAAQQRQDPLAERPRAADQVLPQPALRLVRPEPGRLRERRAVVARLELRLVEPVAELVQAGVERHREVVLLPARREPHVGGGHAAREGVHGGVQAPVLGLEADGGQQLAGHRALVARPGSARGTLPVLAGRRGRRDERHELGLQAREDAPELLRGQAGLVVVEQDVVGVRELAGAVEAGDVAALELEHALQGGREVAEVARLARLQPGLLGVRVGARDLRRELGRHRAALRWSRLSARTSAHVVGVRVRGRRPRLERVEQPAELGVGQPVVLDALQRLELVRPRVAPPGGIIVFWSQSRRPPMPVRSDSSRARRRSSVSWAGAVVHRPARAKTSSSSASGSSSAKCSAGSARSPRAGCRSSAMLSAISRAPASSPSSATASRRGGREVLLDGRRGERSAPAAGSGAAPATSAWSAAETVDQALAAGAQRREQVAELGLQLVELREHAVRRVLDARDVFRGLLAGPGAQLRDAALGGLEDLAHLLRGAPRQRRGGGCVRASNWSATRRRCSSTASGS